LNADSAAPAAITWLSPIDAPEAAWHDRSASEKFQRTRYLYVALLELIRINTFPCAMSKVVSVVFFPNR